MKRQVIKIDQDKCNGCGLCAAACHEGAIGMVDGKAKLLRDDYCDGLGDCLPACPTGAISFEQREAAAYDEAAVKAAQALKTAHSKPQKAGKQPNVPCACPGSESKSINRGKQPDTLPCGCPGSESKSLKGGKKPIQSEPVREQQSQLNQWPVQIKLVPVNAPYFNNSHVLVAASCTAYAYGNFHSNFMENKITIIGCPKLDDINYADKLTEIFRTNSIKSVTVARMEVPCCGGLEIAVKNAIKNSKKNIPLSVITISTDGQIL